MFKVHHIFPSTGEWASVEVDTLEEANIWYACKLKARNIIPSVVTLYDKDDNVIKRNNVGK